MSERAISAARAALALDAGVAARALPVRRLDRPGGGAYVLVVFGPADASVAVAAVDAATSQVMVSARLAGTAPHIAVGAEQAAALVGPSAAAELVWTPCPASYSPLYPLWQVETPGGPVHVDLSGRTWPDLGTAGHGG